MIRIVESAVPRSRNQKSDTHATARELVIHPRLAVLNSIRTWAAEHPLDANDLAAMDRVFALLAEARDGPNLDLVMRAARHRVVAQSPTAAPPLASRLMASTQVIKRAARLDLRAGPQVGGRTPSRRDRRRPVR